MEDIRLFAINEKELETLLEAARIYRENIGKEFGIEKCAILIMKSGKRQMTEGIELRNQEKIRMLEEKVSYKYLGILESDAVRHTKMKEKFLKEYLRSTRKQLKTILHSRNLIKEINTWAVLLVRYSGTFLKWTGEEL